MALTVDNFKRPTGEVKLVDMQKQRHNGAVVQLVSEWEVPFEDGQTVRVKTQLSPGVLKDLAKTEENPTPDGPGLLDALVATLPGYTAQQLATAEAAIPGLEKLKAGVAKTAFGLRQPVEEA